MLFATHYHPLNAETAGDPHIQQGHMAALVGAQRDTGAAVMAGSGTGSGPGSGGDGITFLYQLRQGPCDKSYGLLVSNMPAELLLDALQLAGQTQRWYSTQASAASVRARRVGVF
jgi:DNA mismatch repair ATPase MutS